MVAVHRPVHLVRGHARVLRRRLARLVLAGQHSLARAATRRSGEMPCSSQKGISSASGARQIMLYCGWEETHFFVSGTSSAGLDLLDGPLAEADLARLAGLADLGERLHRLLDRRRRGRGGGTGRGRRSRSAGARARRRSACGSARGRGRCRSPTSGRRPWWRGCRSPRVEVLEDLAPGRLRRARAVDVGGVEEVDAGVEGGPGAGLGLVALHPGPVGEPGAERDLRDLEVRIAELAELHAVHPTQMRLDG